MIVGLTGGIGTGKSTVCGIFKRLGVPIINADDIAHQLVSTDKTVFQAIIQKFGKQFLTADHKIDRGMLRQQIFTIPADRLWLENLLHPMIAKAIVAEAKAFTYPYCIAEIPLLIEANMQDIVDRILTLDCPVEMQLQRAIARKIHTEAEIRAIIAAQIKREHRLATSEDILENTGDMTALTKHIEKLHHQYLSLAS